MCSLLSFTNLEIYITVFNPWVGVLWVICGHPYGDHLDACQSVGVGEERSYHGLGLEKRKEKGTKLHKKIIFVPDVEWLTFLFFFFPLPKLFA